MFYKRIVVKVGTHTICNADGYPTEAKINHISKQIATLIHKGYEVVLVSSGSIGAGAQVFLNSTKPNTLALKQACASIGQPILMSLYRKYFAQHNINVGQILITGDVVTNREQYNNARSTFFELIKKNVLPIVNENDSVAVDELKFGDNDNLAVNVAAIIEADAVIILTDIDGLYKNFGQENQALIHSVEKIDEEIESLVVKTKGNFSTGGMLSKILAAKKSTAIGIPLIILSGDEDNILIKYLSNKKELGTTFLSQKKIKSRKRWLYLHFKEKGKVFIDQGANQALKKGKSLLPVGVLSVEGNFLKGDIVSVYYEDKNLGKGIIEYSSNELKQIKGNSSQKIEAILGYCNNVQVIHTDNIILF